MIRLNKAIAMLGISSRRDADKLIAKGLIKVNGAVVSELGQVVCENDIISYNKTDYKIADTPEEKVWLYYKPVGLVTTHKDERSRETVFDDVKDKIHERVISVGRLDLNSEGLLLLTNNSAFAKMAEDPKNEWARTYRVRIFGTLTKDIVKHIQSPLLIDGIRYKPMKLQYNRSDLDKHKNSWIECTLREGKNREIRKIFNHFSIDVNRLIRIAYGPYKLGDLNPGEVKRINK